MENRIKGLKARGPAGTANFLYDAAGNLSKVNGTPTYTHSARGRLASVAVAADSVNYLYTTLVPGGARFFAYDEQGHTIGEYDQDGNPVYEVVYLGDTPAAVITQTRTVVNGVLNVQTNLSYVYSDHIDTPRVIVRAADQAIQWRWDQAEAYGNTPPNDNPNGLGSFDFNLRFPGQLYDSESNLVYNVNRYYDASTGRYVESDPIGLAGGINPYAYVDGNPLDDADPLGLQAQGAAVVCGPAAIFCACAITAATWGIYNSQQTYSQSSAMHDPDDRMQRQYEAAKARCTPPNPDPLASCSDLSKMIDMLKNSIDRYTYWDLKCSPGRHAQKISEMENRIKGLKERYDRDCTECK